MNFAHSRFCTYLLVLTTGLTACSLAQEEGVTSREAINTLRQAIGLLGEGDFSQAAEKATAAAKLAGDSPQLLQAAAEVLYRSGHSAASLPLFDRVVELSPSAPQNWRRGIALCSCGNRERVPTVRNASLGQSRRCREFGLVLSVYRQDRRD